MDAFDLRIWQGFVPAGGSSASPAVTDQIAIDSRRIASTSAVFIALEGKTDNGHRYIPQAVKAGARFIVAKKGWQPDVPMGDAFLLFVDNPLKALQEIAKAYRSQMPCHVVAIAGSYGKTMVKDLLEAMLAHDFPVAASPESFNSQIGVPLSLLTIRKEHKIALIEAAVSEKNEMDALSEIIGADSCIVTHIGKKHLKTLGGNLKHAAEEILKILKFPLQWAILPKDPHVLDHLAPSAAAASHFWTEPSHLLPHAGLSAGECSEIIPYSVEFPDGKRYDGQIDSGFYYFLDLVNISAKAAWLLGARSDAICRSLSRYTPQPIRTELWRSHSGTLFINDTYCSDPQSIDKSLKLLNTLGSGGHRIFLFGGMRGDRTHAETDYRRAGKAIHEARIDRLLLFGAHHFQPLAEEIRHSSPQTTIDYCPTYEEALDQVRPFVKQGDTVLIKGDEKYPVDTLVKAFNDSIYSNQCLINLAAIAENIQTLRHKIRNQPRCMVMVKALAYGTDEVLMAKFLETCEIDILGVSYADEGVALKRAGAAQSIFVINAAAYEAAKIVKWGLEIGVSNGALVDAVAEEAVKHRKAVKVHLHVDTGMNRFGCRPEEALPLARQIQQCPYLQLEGIMTHFACADDPAHDAFTLEQADSFDAVIEELHRNGIDPPWRHAANSSGCVRFTFPQYNMVRIGLAVYGLSSSKAAKEALELRLALSLISRIVGINRCRQGETISYGRSYHVHRTTQNIAVLPIGYFDGLHRNYSGKGMVMIRRRKAKMVGKICMDFLMVDVTDIPHAAPGDPVLIFGEDEYGNYLSPEDLAAQGDSIVHELITCLGPRIQRIFIFEEARREH